MFIQAVPAKRFGNGNKHAFSSLISDDSQDMQGQDQEVEVLRDLVLENGFIHTVAGALIKNLLGVQQDTKTTMAPPTLSGQTTLTLAENRPENLYQKNCTPCKSTYREKHIVHRELVPHTEEKTSIDI